MKKMIMFLIFISILFTTGCAKDHLITSEEFIVGNNEVVSMINPQNQVLKIINTKKGLDELVQLYMPHLTISEQNVIDLYDEDFFKYKSLVVMSTTSNNPTEYVHAAYIDIFSKKVILEVEMNYLEYQNTSQISKMYFFALDKISSKLSISIKG